MLSAYRMLLIEHAPSVTEGRSGSLTIVKRVQLAALEGFSCKEFCPASTIPVRYQPACSTRFRLCRSNNHYLIAIKACQTLRSTISNSHYG
jgi:hypothetical protein